MTSLRKLGLKHLIKEGLRMTSKLKMIKIKPFERCFPPTMPASFQSHQVASKKNLTNALFTCRSDSAFASDNNNVIKEEEHTVKTGSVSTNHEIYKSLSDLKESSAASLQTSILLMSSIKHFSLQATTITSIPMTIVTSHFK